MSSLVLGEFVEYLAGEYFERQGVYANYAGQELEGAVCAELVLTLGESALEEWCDDRIGQVL